MKTTSTAIHSHQKFPGDERETKDLRSRGEEREERRKNNGSVSHDFRSHPPGGKNSTGIVFSNFGAILYGLTG